MIQELDSSRFRTPAVALPVTMPYPGPQEADNHLLLLGKINALLKTSWALMERTGVITDRAGNALMVRHKNVVVTASQTDAELIAAPAAGYKIRVIGLTMLAGATATSITIGSKVGVAATSTLSGPWTNAANGGLDTGPNIHGIFDDAADTGALVATTGAGSSTTLRIDYLLVPTGGWDWNDGDPIEWNDGGVME